VKDMIQQEQNDYKTTEESDDTTQSKEERTLCIIREINSLIALASREGLGSIARMLYTAKEDIVYWAVDINFHETTKDQFINTLLYSKSSYNS
jgi:hypothetical protein